MKIFIKSEIWQSLLGCFETVLFMRKGVERFSGERDVALRSFIWPLLFFPMTLFGWSFHETGELSLSFQLLLHGGRAFLTLFLFLGIVYFFTKHYERQEHFFQFVTIFNWMNIPAFLLGLPYMVSLILFSSGIGPFESYEGLIAYHAPFGLFSVILGYVYLVFVLTHSLRVPWEMAGFVAIVSLCINETTLDVIAFIRDLA